MFMIPRAHFHDGVLGLDLEALADRHRLNALMGAADILVDGYTEGVLARHGFGEAELNDKCARPCPPTCA